MSSENHDKLVPEVEEAFQRRGIQASDIVIDVVATVGAGILNRASEPFLGLPRLRVPHLALVDVASAVVDRFKDGQHPTPPTLGNYRGQIRVGIDGAFAQLDLPMASEGVRAALATLTMGCLRDGDLRAMRALLPYHVVAVWSFGH